MILLNQIHKLFYIIEREKKYPFNVAHALKTELIKPLKGFIYN